jgi:hypothetical protein
MKAWLIHTASIVAVGVAFASIGQLELRGGHLIGALFGAYLLLNLLLVPRYPRRTLLDQALRLKRGQKVEVEGK